MLDLLREHDPELVELHCGSGGVLVSPGLQGRIFCHIADDLAQRLDATLLEHPSTEEFNNLGGNSLWPAPEGGDFAFNYLPGSDDWLVQKGISDATPAVVDRDASTVVIEKVIDLTNRKGTEIRLKVRRRVSVMGAPTPPHAYELETVGYAVVDTFVPLGEYSTEEVLLAPWSLEQFPGAEGVVAFAKVQEPQKAINFDFYGHPGARIAYDNGHFTFALGGPDRHQIGISVEREPELIGAMDTSRSLLILRKTPPQDGAYFNIADNDQPQGPYSAADCYSIFNGGSLDFFELETIGAMQVVDGKLAESTLRSETLILCGPVAALKQYLAEQAGIHLSREAV